MKLTGSLWFSFYFSVSNVGLGTEGQSVKGGRHHLSFFPFPIVAVFEDVGSMVDHMVCIQKILGLIPGISS